MGRICPLLWSRKGTTYTVCSAPNRQIWQVFTRFFRFFRLTGIFRDAVCCLRTKKQQCAARSSLSAPLVDRPCVSDQQQAVSAAPVWLWSSVLWGRKRAGRPEIQPGHRGVFAPQHRARAWMALREDPLSLLRAPAEGSCAAHDTWCACRVGGQRRERKRGRTVTEQKNKRWESARGRRRQELTVSLQLASWPISVRQTLDPREKRQAGRSAAQLARHTTRVKLEG